MGRPERVLLLGVAQGSAEPARMAVLRYEPKGAAADGPVIGLVGKGVTFDTGGISIKPAENMDKMKDDMSGGAAVICAMSAIARLNLPVRCIGVVPTTENMPGGRAIKPGDILTSAEGKTVEVLNTDAAIYGGSDIGNAGHATAANGEIRLTLPPLAALFLVPGC